MRNGGGLKGTSEAGQGADVIATHPDEKPVSLDGIVISFGALSTTLGGVLKEASLERLSEITTKYVELNQSAEDQKGGINSETKGGGNPDAPEFKSETSNNNTPTVQDSMPLRTVYYSRKIGYNFQKTKTGSTFLGNTGKATDTVPRKKSN